MLSRNLTKTTRTIVYLNSRCFSSEINSETFLTNAHEIATKAANKQTQPLITIPFYRKPGPFTKTHAKYKREARRLEKITESSAISIEKARASFKKLVAFTPSNSPYVSTSESPLNFANDFHLKFRVLTALMQYTKITIPSSKLGSLKNVNDVVSFYQERVKEIEQSKKTKKIQQEYPPNVRIITNKTIISKLGY